MHNIYNIAGEKLRKELFFFFFGEIEKRTYLFLLCHLGGGGIWASQRT